MGRESEKKIFFSKSKIEKLKYQYGAIIIMLMLMEKPEKDFPPGRPVARSPRGGPTMGRPAEWRPELVELADDSVFSTDATIPSSPRGARPMTGSTEAACTPQLCKEMAVG